MKQEDIKKVLFDHGINFAVHGSIIGKIQTTIGAYKCGLGEFVHDDYEHILHFNNDGLAIIPTDELTGKLKSSDLVYFPKEKIVKISTDLSFFNLVLGIDVNIDGENNELKYVIRKNVLGCKWNKENLVYLLTLFSQLEKQNNE